MQDVRAVAAEALVPVASVLSASAQEQVSELKQALWGALADIEDDDPSTGEESVTLTRVVAIPCIGGMPQTPCNTNSCVVAEPDSAGGVQSAE